MQELSLLGKECLINIPMLLDVIAMTVEEMRGMFSPFYNNIKTFLVNELEATGNSCYQFDENKRFIKNGIVKCLEQNDNSNACPQLTISYNLPFTYSCRKKIYAFDAGWEYFASEKCNKIQFYLHDASNTVSILDNVTISNILEQIPDLWQKGEDENGIYMELTIDASFTEEKFLQCLTDFKESVLKPFIAYLGIKNSRNN